MRKLAFLLILLTANAQAEVPDWWLNFGLGLGGWSNELSLASTLGISAKIQENRALTLRASGIIDSSNMYGTAIECGVTGANAANFFCCTADGIDITNRFLPLPP